MRVVIYLRGFARADDRSHCVERGMARAICGEKVHRTDNGFSELDPDNCRTCKMVLARRAL